jgi:hypothetical protein
MWPELELVRNRTGRPELHPGNTAYCRAFPVRSGEKKDGAEMREPAARI